MKELDKPKAAEAAVTDRQRLKTAVYQRVKARPETVHVTDWLERIARDYNISPATARRWAKEVEIYGAYNPKIRNSPGPTNWDPEAISWVIGYYLKAQKEIGDCSKRAAYKALCARAELEGWQIGSEASCYRYLKTHPLLEEYAKGGERALDNLFYISRDLSTLKPFEIVVGDQHRFNFWTRDPDGKLLRPECYVWLDMGTRLVYGLAFDRNYATRTVKLSLKSGVIRFGAFGCTYNDNGKPEISRAMNEIIGELQAWGMKNADLSELYRDETGGYVVEDENGNILGYTEDREEWYRSQRRILANVRNAKAKPIERFFRTLEQILVDKGCPGLVRNIACSAAEDEEIRKRLKKQSRDLLTTSEFADLVVSCIDEYESRRHETLGISPRQRLMEWIEQGWKPIRLSEPDTDWIFMDRERRKIINGRISIGKRDYMGEELREVNGRIDESVGILHYEGRRVEVRHDPDNPEYAFALIDGTIRPLAQVKAIEMLDADALSEQMKKKRGQISAVREAFQSLTRRIDSLTIKTSESHRIEEAKERQKPLEEAPKKLLEEDVSRELEKRLSGRKVVQFEKKVFETAGERYKYCLTILAAGNRLREEDELFVKQFESTLTGTEAVYWQEYRRLLSV